MELKIKTMLGMAIMATVAFTATSCSDDDDNNAGPDTDVKTVFLSKTNENFVNLTVVPTYTGLMETSENLFDALCELNTQADVNKACELWKSARQYWEWSEAFLFGAASSYGIDPHIDTWPFDRKAFDNYMAKYHPATNEGDAEIMEEAIATGQNLTGFHAVEYLLFRDGKPRNISDMTEDEKWFCQAASADLYLNSIRLVAAWGGKLSEDQQTILEDAEMEPEDNFGEEFINAGKSGSRYKTVRGASVQIIEGCQDIIDEVAHAKIGAPHTGEDINYIESPHAYNSIQDFYDNTLSCVHALYGGLGQSKSYSATSLMAYAMAYHPTEAAAVKGAAEEALAKVNLMKKPFVLYYTDATAGNAIEALEAFDDALDALKQKMLSE